MQNITRRDFLKMSGLLSGALLLSGCTADLQQSVWMEPYTRAPEETLPGEDFWFASTCRMCPAGCGIIVRVSNGRARKIEGNPAHPLNRGALCARGQAGLQQLYHPDRLRQVMRRTGERGQGQWGTTSWEQMLDTLAGELKKLEPARIAFLTGLLPDYQAALLARLTDGLGAPPPLVYDTQATMDGRLALQQTMQAMFNTPALPVFDIARADVVYAFGSNFLETWLSPVAYGRAYGQMRGQAGIRGALVSFEPRLSMTAASADRWIPVPPGTEGLLALALGKIIATERLGDASLQTEYQTLYKDVDVPAIAGQVEIPPDELVSLARTFADAHHPVAIPGGGLTGHTNGLEALKAVTALNLIVGHTGEHGALFLSPAAPSRDLRPPASPASLQDVQTLVERMKAGQVDALFVLDANPVYELPAALGFAEALKNVSLVVTFATLPNETTALSDIVLPAHTYLETWGYQLLNPGTAQLVVGAQQPVVRPQLDTRDPADVLLALADKLGGRAAKKLPWPNLVAFIQTRLTSLQLLEGNITAADMQPFWAAWLQNGGWWSQEPRWQSPQPAAGLKETLKVSPPQFEGEAAEYPFHLLPIPSLSLADGRHAALPWLQETPDPMTTASWETWVELNPETARKLGIRPNDVVKISSPAGEIEAIAYLYPGIRPDVVAVPMGQGHTALGRWATGRGANPWAILTPHLSDETGELAWAATRVKVIPTGRKQILPTLEDNIGVERARQKGEVPG